MSEPALDVGRWLDQAEKDYLFEGKVEFRFPLRGAALRARAEPELRRHPFLRINEFRDDREGHTRVGRPSEVSFLLEDLLSQRPQLAATKEAWDSAESTLGGLLAWKAFALAHYGECRKKAEILPVVAKVLRYLSEHRDSVKNLYPRQIPHAQSTKIIGYEPLLLRLYAAHIGAASASWEGFFQDFGLRRRPLSFPFAIDQITWDGVPLRDLRALLDEENAPRWGLTDIKQVLIVENEECFFPLCGQVPGTLLVQGRGKMVARLGFLRPFLAPTAKVFYWGDIDKEGYEILSQAALALGEVTPLGMDAEAIARAWDLLQARAIAEPGARPVKLLEEEYSRVCREGIQIEQEQIGLEEILRQLGP